MENPTIIIKRTKEELRTYNLFSAIIRRPFRRTLQFIIPALGLLQISIYIFWVRSPLNLAIGAFLIIYPFLTRYQILRASDQSYERNNLQDYEINITFNEDNFTTENELLCQKLMFDEMYQVYVRKEDIILYVSKNSGLYISRASYDEKVINQILTILENAIPEKIVK